MSSCRRKSSRYNDGFEEWGGYMDAKKTKLVAQFTRDATNAVTAADAENAIFCGVAIFVNGYTVPSADELKFLMIKYGGVYHQYYDSKITTHVIASNLANCKIKLIKSMKVIKPEWIVESIEAKKLLDSRNYLLYTPTNQPKTRPSLFFQSKIEDHECESNTDNDKFSVGCKKEGFGIDYKCLTKTNHEMEFVKSEDLNKLIVEKNVKCDSGRDTKSGSVNESISQKVRGSEVRTPIGENLCEVYSDNFAINLVNDKLIGKSKFGDHENIPSVRRNMSKLTARDEKFLSEFYSHSRLHHISTIGATFKQYVAQVRAKHCGQFPGRNALKNWLSMQKNIGFPCIKNDDNNEELLYDSTETVRPSSKIIMHIDMDCFFVSVGVRNKPELKGQPVVVTHAKGSSNNHLRNTGNFKSEICICKNHLESKVKMKTALRKTDEVDRGINVAGCSLSHFNWVNMVGETDSMSEIASCSYEARKAGVKNGMFLGQALKLCPNLKTISYNFDSYKEVSYILYSTVSKYTLDIEAVSCDEMFVDCTELLRETSCTPMYFASFLRKQLKCSLIQCVFDPATYCPADMFDCVSFIVLIRINERLVDPNTESTL